MAHYIWTNDLNVGEETIDAQHKWLVDTYNYLMSTYKTDLTSDWLITSLTHLYEYTENHFGYEESLQIKYRFPDYERHKQLHAAFKQSALDLVERVKTEGPSEDIKLTLNAVIGAWLIKHIKEEDLKLAAYIKKATN
jgi:hemerythrin